MREQDGSQCQLFYDAASIVDIVKSIMICSFVKDERFGSNRIGNLVEFYMNDYNDRIIEIFKII